MTTPKASTVDLETEFNYVTLKWDPPLCEAMHPTQYWPCSRVKGHRGVHVSLNDPDTIRCAWRDRP